MFLLTVLVFFSSKARAEANSRNRLCNTTNHHAGSRPFAAFMDDVRREKPGVNPYVGAFEKAYPYSPEDLVSHFALINFIYIYY